jgi:hypothetical protein
MKSCWFNQIFLAASAKVSSRTRAILYNVMVDSAISG